MRSKRRVQAHVARRIEHAEAVRPDEPDPGVTAGVQELSLPSGALPASLSEARRDHQHGANARQRAIPRRPDDSLSGHAHDRQFDRAGKLAHRAEGGQALDLVRAVVDRVDLAAVATRDQIVQQLTANRPPPARRPDHRNRSRLQNAAHRSDRGDAFALLEPSDPVG
jgi:hypothetical protein